MGLAPEKLLLKWMNFHLKKAGYKKPVTNFSSDLKVVSHSLLSFKDIVIIPCTFIVYKKGKMVITVIH